MPPEDVNQIIDHEPAPTQDAAQVPATPKPMKITPKSAVAAPTQAIKAKTAVAARRKNIMTSSLGLTGIAPIARATLLGGMT